MKSVRIGCGSGCSFDRIEPAVDLLKNGNLDYLVFECLAERTISDDMKRKKENSELGYTPMLEERFRKILPILKQAKTKIITNMGSANVFAAVNKVSQLCEEFGLSNLKIAYQYGDEISRQLVKDGNIKLIDDEYCFEDIKDNIISSNLYFGYSGVLEALKSDADIIITGRIADASLFIAPVIFELGYTDEIYANATLMGHLLECAGQLTGGYYCNPGYDDVDDLANLGFPIAEFFEDSKIILSKTQKSGGLISKSTVIQQMFYEVSDPQSYITPDGVVDFTSVNIDEVDINEVLVTGAKFVSNVDTYKVNIGFLDGYLGVGEISFGGLNSLQLASCCEEIIKKRWTLINCSPNKFNFSIIGFNSLYGNKISSLISSDLPSEVRLRVVVKDNDKELVKKAIREVDFMYTNGPAGSSGIRTSVNENVGITSAIINKGQLKPIVEFREII